MAIKVTKNIRDYSEVIEELAESIKSSRGLMQPLVITNSPTGGFELVAVHAQVLKGATCVDVAVPWSRQGNIYWRKIKKFE